MLKEAKDISKAAVYRVLEEPIAMVPYVSLNFYEKCFDCPDEAACSVHSLMVAVRDRNLKIIENTSLADFVMLK